MRRYIIAVFIVGLALIMTAPFATAACGLRHDSGTAKSSESSEAVNSVCPVLGKKMEEIHPSLNEGQAARENVRPERKPLEEFAFHNKYSLKE